MAESSLTERECTVKHLLYHRGVMIQKQQLQSDSIRRFWRPEQHPHIRLCFVAVRHIGMQIRVRHTCGQSTATRQEPVDQDAGRK